MATTVNRLPVLHRALITGLLTLAAMFLVLNYRGIVPLKGSDNATLIASVLSGVSVVQVMVAFLVLKPRVPLRAHGQSVEQYWATPSSNEKVMLVWFVMEGAGILSLIGYFLTGEPVSAVTAGLAIVVFGRCGPSVFAEA